MFILPLGSVGGCHKYYKSYNFSTSLLLSLFLSYNFLQDPNSLRPIPPAILPLNINTAMATPQPCAHCGAPCAHCGAVSDTAQRCTGCLDGSDYLVEDVSDTFYCSKKCQKKHWSVHKADCEKVAKHKLVFRFGRLLKQVFLAYKETFYEHDVSKIEIKDGIFALYCDKTGEHDGVLGRGWRPFPAHVAANDIEREAALTIEQCGVALSLLGPLARKLMRGTSAGLTLMWF